MNIFTLAQQVDLSSLPKVGANGSSNVIAVVLQIVFGVIGAISVLIITLAGFKYVTSRGNPEETAKAKDTIVYAAIGIAVSLLAYAIVAFVVSHI